MKELTNGLVTAAEGNEDEDGFPEKPALIVTAHCPYELYVRLKCAFTERRNKQSKPSPIDLKAKFRGSRPDERFAKTGIHSSSWLARSGKRTAGNPRSLDVTGAGAGQKTKLGMSRIALPKKSYLVSREQYIDTGFAVQSTFCSKEDLIHFWELGRQSEFDLGTTPHTEKAECSFRYWLVEESEN
ncbi:hypothetical protein Salat_2579300 [Sesamum alatum]|uniref:Uncharacterized protein n=1 Tax=Sesamum alatum TaxID=300844 RepID=A0AAE2CA54_9LAMI|nr:hypothetical protein Salat_2579300 [Sesamum alatum]